MVLSLPSKILFIDVETTGLSDVDKVVSFGAVQLNSSDIKQGIETLSLGVIHLIFDPGIPSHPMALKVHGYDDWTLRHQEPFPLYAYFIRSMVSQSDLVVAHNADFDLRFLSRELVAGGETWPDVGTYCTMQVERRLGLPASLDASCRRLGMTNRGKRHSALDDALRAMVVFLNQHGILARNVPEKSKKPTNFKRVPRKPKDGVPDRVPAIEQGRIERLANGLANIRREVLPALLVIRWIVRDAFSEDKKTEAAIIAFVQAEAAIVDPNFVESFCKNALLDLAHTPCDWLEVRAALDTIRFDPQKRRRLSIAIEDCIRADGTIALDEIDRLRQVADYLGGQIADGRISM